MVCGSYLPSHFQKNNLTNMCLLVLQFLGVIFLVFSDNFFAAWQLFDISNLALPVRCCPSPFPTSGVTTYLYIYYPLFSIPSSF